MIDLDPVHLAAALPMVEPLVIRTIAFDFPIFDLLKQLQRKLESRIRWDTGNAEVLKYVIYTHPETQATPA